MLAETRVKALPNLKISSKAKSQKPKAKKKDKSDY